MDSRGKLIINHSQEEEDSLVLFLSGDLDVQTAPQLKRFIDRMIGEGAVNMKLDLSRLSYLDSSGYIVLINATRSARGTRCRLNLTNMPPWMTEFFDLSALEA